jgi:hypothetical protein
VERASRLNLPAIDASLREVQAGFARINRELSTPREVMTDELRANMMAGYRLVDNLLARGTDLFELGRSKRLLELNTLVLCGADGEKREEFSQHMTSTERRFYEQEGGGIADLMEWLKLHRGNDVWKRAAGVYIHILSRPQLFIEGNHRTGALVMSYILAREEHPPFVLSVDNAKAYFDPSILIKETKRHSLGMLIRLPKLKKRFAKLLKDHADERYLMASALPSAASR